MDKKTIVKIIAIVGAIVTAVGAYFGLDIHLTATEKNPVAVEAPAE